MNGEICLQKLLELWQTFPAECGAQWDAVEHRLERVLERLYAAVEPDAGAYLEAQLRDIFRDFPRVLAALLPPITRRGLGRADGRRRKPLPPAVLRSLTRGGGPPPEPDPPERIRLSTLVGRARDIINPARLVHYVDLSCPDCVRVRTPRFTLVVRLSASAPLLPVAAVVNLVKTGKVLLCLDAPGFDVLGPSEQEVPVSDSPPVVFDLRPRGLGKHKVFLDIWQHGNRIGGGVACEVDCVEEAAAMYAVDRVPLEFDAAAAPPDMVLRVTTQGERITFHLAAPDLPLRSQSFYGDDEVRDVASYAANLYRDLGELAGVREAGASDGRATARPIPEEVFRRVQSIGRRLWNDLIPTDFKRLYRDLHDAWKGRTLLLQSDEPHVPWELVWPYGEHYADPDPWCCTFRMTRWLDERSTRRRDDRSVSVLQGPPGRLRLRTMAVVAPEDAGLPNARKERNTVADLFGPRGVQVVNTPAEYVKVMELLEGGKEGGGYDWLHVVAHGTFDGSSRVPSLRLEGNRRFTPDALVGPEVERHISLWHPAFVFNACQGARQGYGLTGLAGWAARLLGLGAGLFAGALWEINDETALAFIQTFYAGLLGGITVGEALNGARLQARKDGDPTWLAYSVYAHPNARLALPDARP